MMARNIKAAAAAGSGIAGASMQGGSFNKQTAGPSINRVGVSMADKAIAMVKEKRLKEEEEARKKAEELAAAGGPAVAAKPSGPQHAYSTGKAAASFTSTYGDVITANDNAYYTEEDIREVRRFSLVSFLRGRTPLLTRVS